MEMNETKRNEMKTTTTAATTSTSPGSDNISIMATLAKLCSLRAVAAISNRCDGWLPLKRANNNDGGGDDDDVNEPTSYICCAHSFSQAATVRWL